VSDSVPAGWEWNGTEGIRSVRRLAEFIYSTYDGLQIPAVAVCPGHSSPWAAFLDAYYAVTPIVVWKASRGFGGKSFLLSLLGDVTALTMNAEVNLLGGSGQQSKRVLEAISTLHTKQNYPRYRITDEQTHITRFQGGASLQALMASQTSVRGPHPQRLLLDEVDEMDLDIFDASMGQPMSKGACLAGVTASSTHQHADGTMTEILRRAATRGWKVHEWCYRETMRTADNPFGWLEEEEVERKKLVIPNSMWNAEYEGQEPNPEGRAFMTEWVDKTFDPALGEIDVQEGRYYEFEPPVAEARYATGADWARKIDRTIIVTLRTDVKPARLVAFEALRRREWPQMIAQFEKRLRRYPGKAAHDGTGIGDVVAGIMKGVRAEAVVLVGRDRADILTEYVSGIERGDVIAPRINLMYGEHRYASVDDLYKGGGDSHLPDTVCAMAMAYKVGCKRRGLAWGTA
jgi:hypothetical protein